jgi:hypothetical protein
MMRPEEFEHALCRAFCGAITVRAVPTGYAVSTAFTDASGDRLSFYVSETGDGYRIEDDGDYLSHLIARDIPIDEGTRGQLLDAILQQGSAYWDRETYEIRTPDFSAEDLPKRAIDFLSSLLRVRDLELVTRDVVRSTFREDVLNVMNERFGPDVSIEENVAPANDFAEFPADIVVKPVSPKSQARTGAVYLVNSNDKLNEALLAAVEAQMQNRDDLAILALIEEPDMRLISRKKFQRAQNRGLPMPIFRGDEEAAMTRVAKELRLAPRAA